jgi:hypothetical protein
MPGAGHRHKKGGGCSGTQLKPKAMF